ncbi:MAG: DUF5752 family protein [Candidatus Bathyarchaeia archaeon]
MIKPHNLNKLAIAKSTAEKILASVPYTNGFHFFTSVGQYTGETAVSLATFAKEVEVTPIESIDFHFKTADFQKWISETIGDAELATAIGHIEKELNGEPLRRRILKIVNERVSELEIQIQHASTPGSKK